MPETGLARFAGFARVGGSVDLEAASAVISRPPGDG